MLLPDMAYLRAPWVDIGGHYMESAMDTAENDKAGLVRVPELTQVDADDIGHRNMENTAQNGDDNAGFDRRSCQTMHLTGPPQQGSQAAYCDSQ